MEPTGEPLENSERWSSELRTITSSTASGTVLLPAGYRHFELEFTNLVPVTNPQSFAAQLSTDGGSTWVTTASYYHSTLYNSSATAAAYLQVEGERIYILLSILKARYLPLIPE